jgi:hypothetical protein
MIQGGNKRCNFYQQNLSLSIQITFSQIQSRGIVPLRTCSERTNKSSSSSSYIVIPRLLDDKIVLNMYSFFFLRNPYMSESQLPGNFRGLWSASPTLFLEGVKDLNTSVSILKNMFIKLAFVPFRQNCCLQCVPNSLEFLCQ